jgi:hypothetical protein
MLVNKYNPNFIVIEKEVIQEAIAKGDITKVGENYKGNGNVYYRVNKLRNVILMNVKDDRFIVINEVVEHDSRIIGLVPILSKISFYINNTRAKERNIRERVKAFISIDKGTPAKTEYIERIIRGIIINGKISELPSGYQIHHKWNTFDQRESTTMLVHEKLHTHRKNHLRGRYVDSIEGFYGLVEELVGADIYYSCVTVVE